MGVCGNCFRELNTRRSCPYCGWDGREQEEKYPLALQPGAILNGRYIVGRVLGQGGFGVTYTAQDYRTKKRVAIKEYLPMEFAGRGGTCMVQPFSGERQERFQYGMEQFLEEARALAAFMGDEHIVRIHSYFEENGTAYFVMEYVEGLPLDKYAKRFGGRLSVQETARLLLPVTESLARVHAAGMIHRDISPDNIIVQPDGTAKLIDFGAARFASGEKTNSLDVILKHGFSPKEQYARHSRQGPFTDIYAMGATFYYTLTGRIPPDAISRTEGERLIPLGELGVSIGPRAEKVLLKALESNGQDRWQSAAQFHRELARALAVAPPPAPAPPRPVPQRERSAGKRDTVLRAVIALLSVVLVVSTAASLLGRDKPVTRGGKSRGAPPATSAPQRELPAAPKSGLDCRLDGTVLRITGSGTVEKLGELVPDWDARRGGVTRVALGEGISGVGDAAFAHCGSLEAFEVPSANQSLRAADGLLLSKDGRALLCVPGGLRGALTLPEGIAEIRSWAFADCAGLTELTLPASLTRIGDAAFARCLGLRDLRVPAENGSFLAEYGLLLTKDRKELLWVSPVKKGELAIPAGTAEIRGWAFSGCDGLTTVRLPDGVKEIGGSAFRDCRGLKTVRLPTSLTRIGDFAFRGCDRLDMIQYTGSSDEWKRITCGDRTFPDEYTVGFYYS